MPLTRYVYCFPSSNLVSRALPFNFTTADECQIFPIPTIKERRTFSLKEPDWFHNVLLHKYKSRGYQDVQRKPTIEEDTACGGCFGMTHETFTRRVGDEFTWKVDLHTEGMMPSQVSSSIEDVVFEIKGGAKPEDGLQWMKLHPID